MLLALCMPHLDKHACGPPRLVCMQTRHSGQCELCSMGGDCDMGPERLPDQAGKGSATLSMAYAAAKFAEACLAALAGESVIECAYVESHLTELPFFASRVRLGRGGVEARSSASCACSLIMPGRTWAHACARRGPACMCSVEGVGLRSIAGDTLQAGSLEDGHGMIAKDSTTVAMCLGPEVLGMCLWTLVHVEPVGGVGCNGPGFCGSMPACAFQRPDSLLPCLRRSTCR